MTHSVDTGAADALAARATERARGDGTTVVAVAGPVAVGKSTLAAALAAALEGTGHSSAVVATDGFLFPTAELVARGLLDRKGFPETYDDVALRTFLAAARSTDSPRPPLTVPVYSHETYDVVSGAHRVLPPVTMLVVEGVNALSATTGLVDFGIYIDAPLDVIEAWYTQRFLRLCAEARPGSFYARFAGMDRPTLAAAAKTVYESVNAPNLRDYIAPSRRFADVVVEKRADHVIGGIVDVAPR